MIRGLAAKSFRETWSSTLLFGSALFAVMCLLTRVVPQLQEVIGGVFAQFPLVRTMLGALLGIDVGQGITAQMLQAFVWVHPVVLATVWGQEIVYCTRLPAAEIESGTIDLLLGLPVARRAVFLADTLVWLASGLVVLGMGLGGHLLGARAMPASTHPGLTRLLLVLANLYCVYLAVGGLAYLASVSSSRRAPAVTAVFTITVASFLLTFLARFWAPAERLAFLSVLDYYRPAEVLIKGQLPLRDVLTLLATGGVCWLVSGEILARRSICTV